MKFTSEGQRASGYYALPSRSPRGLVVFDKGYGSGASQMQPVLKWWAREMGVIAKRPIANAAWKTGHRPIDSYHHEYFERLRKLNYDFLQHDLDKSISIALRFTLSIPGVNTAIVGTKKPERWEQNAKLLSEGALSDAEFAAIRERWEECAPRTWIGQI